MLRLLLLGERRIAMRCFNRVLKSYHGRSIEVVGIATTPDMYQQLAAMQSCTSTIAFIDNLRRNEEELCTLIRKSGCDALISVQHPWILSRRVLELMNFRAFNLHNAELPTFRGYNSVSHALLAGVKTYTSSIHWIAEHVDAGDLAYTSSVPVDPSEDVISLYEKTLEPATHVFKQLIDDLLDGVEPPRIAQTGKSAFYGRDQLSQKKDCTGLPVEDLAHVARACFFPPDEPAYIEDANGKAYLVPERFWETLKRAMLPANLSYHEVETCD